METFTATRTIHHDGLVIEVEARPNGTTLTGQERDHVARLARAGVTQATLFGQSWKVIGGLD